LPLNSTAFKEILGTFIFNSAMNRDIKGRL